MALTDRTYARLVGWAKIGLPLLALALLSTLFLLSRQVSSVADLPFSEGELRDRVQGQVLTAPYYSGTTDDGATITLKADRARPGEGRAVAEAVTVRIRSDENGTLDINAAEAVMDDNLDSASLTGDVMIRSSQGYVVETNAVVSALSILNVETEGPVTADAPEGRIAAGRLRISGNTKGAAQMVFTDGVKLVYQPPREE